MGGGADADLWSFNAEPVVRTIADCRTPVVAAIGHEDDTTLCEDVADRRAMTPTDAGVRVTPDVDTVWSEMADLEPRVDGAYHRFVADALAGRKRRIDTAHRSLVEAALTARAERLGQLQTAAHLEAHISSAYDDRVGDALAAVERRRDDALRELEHAVATDAVTARAARGRVADLEARIDGAYRTRVGREIGDRISRLEAIAETLEDGTVDLEQAKELREEADEHLSALQTELDVGDGELIKVDADDGTERWRVTADSRLTTPVPGVDRAFAGSESGIVYSFES